ncbi:MAG: hypothetical protein U5M50_02250 [Sphingobium sp.]|nr:hypothetical protein [Sphingobium sp.]
MAVKFKVSTQVGALYNPGDIAGFDKKTEAELVKAGVAERYEAPKSDAPAEGAPNPDKK